MSYNLNPWVEFKSIIYHASQLKSIVIGYLDMVGLGGFEPPTSRLSGVRSHQTELQAQTVI